MGFLGLRGVPEAGNRAGGRVARGSRRFCSGTGPLLKGHNTVGGSLASKLALVCEVLFRAGGCVANPWGRSPLAPILHAAWFESSPRLGLRQLSLLSRVHPWVLREVQAVRTPSQHDT